ncbi:exodeoxyribonuclease III [Alteromonas aestuariivivens]|uniref:Exodeoxyribonuclease III n=1 Tax=Alteromonas aestuariivivens TaxID=1938339 RepID=A0A3D8MBV7_9ALTE|nr:exodeoxyribonuclease III [Alteromonas aestuariivivens]RDV27479.1 exodeoxyribonuclease III [Alteromonas aestuariivivens]
MKIISFNINGIRARLHQLAALIEKHQPDVIGLQEIKVHNDQFPLEAVQALGYHVFFHGQKSHYGVAMLTRQEPLDVQLGFPTDEPDAQRRMIMVTVKGENSGQPVTVLNGYFPQGENQSHEIKYPAKRKFYADLMTHLNEHHSVDDNVIVMGDLNISPTDLDIGIGEDNRKRWLRSGKCSFLPEEREWIERLYDWGLTDSYRAQNPQEDDRFSWFDYRSKGFDDNRGLRIDHILATPPLHKTLQETGIDYDLRAMEKPSDHAPIWAVYDI